MIYIEVGLSALFSFLVMFLLAKLMGVRQISQLSMFDYINGITIGSIAAEIAISTDMQERLYMSVALAVYALATLLFSWFTDKSIAARRFITGKPVVLVEHGRFYDDNFRKVKMDINEFMTQCRNSGFFDVSQVDTAIMETNGRLSIMPASYARPLTPEDMNITSEQETLSANVIIDGKVMCENLKAIGYDEDWLLTQLKNNSFNSVEDIFLATALPNGKLSVYLKCGTLKKEIFL